MKINKEQLIALLKDSTNSEFSLSELIELTEDMPQVVRNPQEKSTVGINTNVYNETDTAIQFDNSPNFAPSKIRDTVHEIKHSNPRRKYDNNESEKLYPHVQRMLDNGYIRDPKYAQVLSGNKKYMTYLKENPTLFLEKRIEWKINKLVGLTSYNTVAKDMYLGTTLEIVHSRSVRDLETLLLERLHIPQESLTNIQLIDLIYLLDSYGVDPFKIIFFLLRSNEKTPHWLNTLYIKGATPRSLRDIPLSETEHVLLGIRDLLASQIVKTNSYPDKIKKSINKIYDLLYDSNIETALGIPEGATIGNLIDPMAHTYKERKMVRKHLTRLYNNEKNINTQDYKTFDRVYGLAIGLSSVYRVNFPYTMSLDDLFNNRQPFINLYDVLINTVGNKLQDLA